MSNGGYHEDIGRQEGKLEKVELNGRTWAVISAGGFLGIGDKEVPIELSRLSFGEDGIVVEGLTEEQIDAAKDVDLEGAEELPADAKLETAM